MIPSNIENKHILQALEEIDRSNYPENREPTEYYLHHKGKNYPPKFVISLANKYANKKELPPEEFSGGNEANTFLKSRMFEIITKDSIIDKEKLIKLLVNGCKKRNLIVAQMSKEFEGKVEGFIISNEINTVKVYLNFKF